jgi:hypothetical protein
MITHIDAAKAHERAAQLAEAAAVAQARAGKPESSLFSQAYADAKRREVLAAVVTASAQARWAMWRIPHARP